MKKNLITFCSTEVGITSVELAFLAPLFLALLLGATELGLRVWTVTQLNGAATAGIEYALNEYFRYLTDNSNPNFLASNTNTAVVQPALAVNTNTAVVQATPLAVTANSTTSSGCPTATGVTFGSATTCPDGNAAGTYVIVPVTTTYTPLFHGCGFLQAYLPTSICPSTLTSLTFNWTATARLY